MSLKQRLFVWSVFCLFSVSMSLEAKDKIAVAAVRTETAPIIEWRFAEGIAQGIRREFLNFERAGKVVFLAEENVGRQIRAGSKVVGPKQGETFGQLLARVDERSDIQAVKQNEAALEASRLRITQAEAQLEQAKNNLNLAEANFERNKQMWQKKLLSKNQYDSARTELLNAQQNLQSAAASLEAAKSDQASAVAQLNQAKVSLEKTSIFAPFDGVIRKLNIRVGDYAAGPAGGVSDRERESGAAIVVIDTSQYEVTLEIPYYEAGDIQEGQKVYLSFSSHQLHEASKNNFSDKDIAIGSVYSVSPSISLDKRAVEVKVHTQTNANALRDGLFTTAWIVNKEKSDALVLPQSALIIRGRQAFVYKVSADGETAKLQPVTLGIEGLSKVEILSGLEPGDRVVTTGKHKLVDQSAIRIVKEGV
ncbi:efflux RND transporter periplasmic adaptor subunit [Pleionea sp. CnH1-48]|uniref:efflux RND transporter periplasmic adaptor subunit n=1 Tax=Pleionea sp. CnH1-48 TaxID=2954494 RepID=UPI002097FF34|nr:efflux RND transporter periplasmic adaptor subunit [Pleionea sp. CnH1-48]MCO7223353.1 efflux RND transporter periplasmic adaptor subunit [Pleionea sp. CnH1-48]